MITHSPEKKLLDNTLYQLSPNLDIGFQDDKLLLSTGANPAIVFEDEQAQHQIVDLCLALQTAKTKAEIIHIASEQLFNQFLNWHFLIKAYTFDPNDRNSRNLLFYNLTETDPNLIHERLQKKHVIIIGCGGVGNNIATHLVNAGIGKMTLVDNDVVEASNLTRQIMFTTADVENKNKTDALAHALKCRTLHTQIETLPLFVTYETIQQLPDCDLIIIAADSKSIGVDVNRYAHKTKTPFIAAGYSAQHACFGPLVIPQQSACYECFKNRYLWSLSSKNTALQEKIDKITARGFDASLSPVVAVSGALASLDIIHFLGDFGEVLSKQCAVSLDTKTLRWNYQDFDRLSGCPYCFKSNLAIS